MLLPAATACAPATFGLSASPVWPSFSLAADRLEYLPCDKYPPHIADAVSSASSGSLRLTWQISYTVSVRPQPKPRPVTTVHRKYLGRILEQAPKNLPTLHLQYLQPSSPTIFIVCAAGPFPSETLGLASRQNRRCSLLLLRPCRGSPCCLPLLPLAEQLQKTQASSDSGHRTLALMAMYLSQIYLQRKNEGNL